MGILLGTPVQLNATCSDIKSTFMMPIINKSFFPSSLPVSSLIHTLKPLEEVRAEDFGDVVEWEAF